MDQRIDIEDFAVTCRWTCANSWNWIVFATASRGGNARRGLLESLCVASWYSWP